MILIKLDHFQCGFTDTCVIIWWNQWIQKFVKNICDPRATEVKLELIHIHFSKFSTFRTANTTNPMQSLVITKMFPVEYLLWSNHLWRKYVPWNHIEPSRKPFVQHVDPRFRLSENIVVSSLDLFYKHVYNSGCKTANRGNSLRSSAHNGYFASDIHSWCRWYENKRFSGDKNTARTIYKVVGTVKSGVFYYWAQQ